MSDWIDIGAFEDIPPLGSRIIKTKIGCVAVFRNESDEVFALENSCPHKKGPLSEGFVHGKTVTCPLHNWIISMEDGTVQGGVDEGQVATFALQVVDGRLLLDRTGLEAAKAA